MPLFSLDATDDDDDETNCTASATVDGCRKTIPSDVAIALCIVGRSVPSTFAGPICKMSSITSFLCFAVTDREVIKQDNTT